MKKKKIKITGKTEVPPWGRMLITIALLAISAIFLAQKIDMNSADLGRHLMNGRIFFEHLSPVTTNYYSFTEKNIPVVNHHWGSGVIYFIIYKLPKLKNIIKLYTSMRSFVLIHPKTNDNNEQYHLFSYRTFFLNFRQ